MSDAKISDLPRSILLLIAKLFGFRQPERATNVELVDFITRSLPL